MSSDGTFEVINSFKDHGVNIFREVDYKKKGIIMTELIRKYCDNDIAYPLDIDEFIVHYDKNNNKISNNKYIIIDYINNLPIKSTYKTNYISSKIINDIGYNNIEDTICGVYCDYGNFAKSFFNTSLFKGNIDHGNHYMTNNYYLTDLCLVHYHARNLNQMKLKIYNNVLGLGYDINNIDKLKELSRIGCDGVHHVNNIINILENKYILPKSHYIESDILLKPLSDTIIELKK